MKKASNRVMIMGADGATFRLIKPWVEEGKLPHFRAMMEEGVHGLLDPAPNMRSAASWTSYYTGKNPGKHSIFEFFDYVPESYAIRFVCGADCAEPSLWRLLSDVGYSSIAVNVPMTYPAEPIQGIVLAGLEAPGTGSRGFCYPERILKELEEKFEKYIIEPGLTGCNIDNRLDEGIERLFAEIEQKRKIMFYLIEKKPWDFCTVVFRSLDAAQHNFWKFMDPGHPDHDPGLKDKYGNVIFRVYQKLDEILGELRVCLGPDDYLLVMSDHGFGRKHPASNQLNAWLTSLGYLTFKNRRHNSRIKQSLFRAFHHTYVLLAGKLPRRYKEVFARLLPRVRNRVHTQLCFNGIDWNKTRAYSDTLFPNIRINLKDREKHGIVNSAEYDALINEIKGALMACKDKKTGEPIVEQVMLRNDIYQGQHVNKSPDMTIRWREDTEISGINIDSDSDFSELRGTRPFIPAEDHRVISGDHRRYGILLVQGPGIMKGKMINNAHIMDLAPTTLYLLNTAIPSDMDGKILESAFEKAVLKKKPPKYAARQEKDVSGNEKPTYSPGEEEVVAERLRSLGYLE
jgi:predicted AlkP superfamily phosphohydrolase/phosphomutase